MAGKRGPESHLKRQRERAKQQERMEKLARRQERNAAKRAAKQALDAGPPPVADGSQDQSDT
ncbi:MAG: hypothetical protein AB1486_20630 [Planctomycetota bacterium]